MSDNLNLTPAGPNTYGAYRQDHQYEYDNGLVVMAVAGRTSKHRLIRLHGGVGMRRVNWHAERRGKPPVVPSMVDTEFDTFVGGNVTASLPQPDPQSIGYNWLVRGTYLYVQTTPRVVGTDTIPTGSFPFPVVPNDAVANTLMSDQSGTFLTADTAGNNPYDAVAKAVGDSTVDNDDESYVWPFTVLPPIFTNDTLFGN